MNIMTNDKVRIKAYNMSWAVTHKTSWSHLLYMENVRLITETKKEVSEAAYLKHWWDTLLIDAINW
jgi:hypothetical protein